MFQSATIATTWQNDSGSSYKLVIIRERANAIRHRSEIAVEV